MPFSISVTTGPDASEEQSAGVLTFDGTQRVVIGRSAGCDVRVPDTTVSLRHASLRSNGADIVLVDEGSTNGTYVRGQRLDPNTPCSIAIGSSFNVGGATVLIREAAGPATRDVAGAARELAMNLVRAKLRKSGTDPAPLVRVVDGRDVGLKLRLAEAAQQLTIGGGGAASLRLSDRDAAPLEVELVRRGANTLVRAIDSRRPIFLGETKLAVGQEMAWRAGVSLRIGATQLAVLEPVVDALARLESGADERLLEAPRAPEQLVSASEASSRDTPPAHGAPPANSAPPPRGRQTAERGVVLERGLALFALGVIALSILGIVWLVRSAR